MELQGLSIIRPLAQSESGIEKKVCLCTFNPIPASDWVEARGFASGCCREMGLLESVDLPQVSFSELKSKCVCLCARDCMCMYV